MLVALKFELIVLTFEGGFGGGGDGKAVGKAGRNRLATE